MKKILILLILLFVGLYNTSNQTIKINYNKEFKEYQEKKKREILKEKIDTIVTVISYIETRNDSTKFNPKENAAGLLQIRPVMVDEVNQILGYNKYTYKDRWSKEKSIEMFIIYQNFVNPKYNEELAARYWNGGRTGNKKSSTDRYVKLYYKYKDVIYDDSCLLAEK